MINWPLLFGLGEVLLALVAGVLGYLYRDHEQRLRFMEKNSETKEEAHAQRELLRRDIRETGMSLVAQIATITGAMETTRKENNEKFTKVSDQLSAIHDRLPRKSK